MNAVKKTLFVKDQSEQSSQDDEFMRRLEQRYAFNYKTAASSLVSRFDSSLLESLVESIEKEEFPQDTVGDVLLFHAKKLLDLAGYTNNIIKSKSHRKLKKQYASLDTSLSQTNNQLKYTKDRMGTLNTYISSTSLQMDDLGKDLNNMQKDIETFSQEIQDYKKVMDQQFDHKGQTYLRQAEFDYELKKHEINDTRSNLDLCLQIQEEYYMDKAQEASLITMFEADKLVIESLKNKVMYELKKTSYDHPIKTLSSTKATVTKTYKLQDEMVAKEERLRDQYNAIIKSSPSITDFQKSMMDKKKQLKPILR